MHSTKQNTLTKSVKLPPNPKPIAISIQTHNIIQYILKDALVLRN